MWITAFIALQCQEAMTASCSSMVAKLNQFPHQNSEIPVNHLHIHSLIPKCNSLRELKQIQAYAIKTNPQNDIFFIKNLIDFCTLTPNLESLHHAQNLFHQIPDPDIVLFNLLARGFARSETPLQSLLIFVDILKLGLLPDEYTFPSLLKSCANANALQEGMQLHCFAVKYGLSCNEFVSPALMNMYIAGDEIALARRVFDGVMEPCIVAYNALLIGYVRSSDPSEALALFRELQAGGIQPTDVTLLGAVSACALTGSLRLGKWLRDYAKKNGFDENVKVNTALIDMFAKCGSLMDALGVFEGMDFRDKKAWSTMIMAYAVHGCGAEAVSLFEEMVRYEIQPDSVTFLAVLYACNHAGLVDDCLSYFTRMHDEFRIAPGIKHYGCVLDTLGRAGRLDDAWEFIASLPIRPAPFLWRTLLAACSKHGNFALGKKVMERILELDTSNSGDYVVFANICARAGRWEEVKACKKMMKNRVLPKVPGCSSIEVENTVHEFFSGDGTKMEYRELHRAVDNLMERLKLVGYVPDTSSVVHLDMEEEEKESTLRYHSEKLAITFGLLNSPPGETIRVVKNLRICSDCHDAAKLISSVFDRTIVLRDVQRFHHIKDGKCSCGDYW